MGSWVQVSVPHISILVSFFDLCSLSNSWFQPCSKYDLYTKTDDELPDVEELKPYYQKLIDQYIPGVLEW